jgi:FlaA1/EpsC-like NDP-sugar epimerase
MIKGNNRIIIFGGTGSLGQALIRRLGENNQLFLFSRDEAKHWTIRNKLSEKHNVKFIVGDIRDKDRVLSSLIQVNPNIVTIAAALKQVDTCENSPFESVQTNIIGVQNIVSSVINNRDKLPDLNAVLLVSTDKACAPTNVYGMCKAVAERIITSSETFLNGPKFVGVRYGNVLESRGSIIPLFKHQVEFQTHITVTNTEMTRFIMTLDQSIDLIEATLLGAINGEIWLPKIVSMRIMDLAEIFAKKFNKEIKIIGSRPGEKIHEDLISETESTRVKFSDNYYKMSSTLVPQYNADNHYFKLSSSQNLLSKIELEEYLDSIGIFAKTIDSFIGRSIEEIKLNS